MRFPIGLLIVLLLPGCFPAKPMPPTAVVRTAAPVLETPKIETFVPASPPNPPQTTTREISGIDFVGVSFDSRNHRLVVADQPGGPGTRYADAESVTRSLGGIAAVNAGFFTPEGTPLGLVVSSGKISGSWNTASSLGSGAWFQNSSGVTAIARRSELSRSAAAAMRELIQAGPLLVENNRPVGGLEATKSSARTLILWDGGTRWWIGCSSPCTLAAVSQALATGEPAGWPVRSVLNLDGGRSSDLSISPSVAGGPVLRRPPWNRPVRNFLVLVAK